MKHSESTLSTIAVWVGVWLALALLCSGVALFFADGVTSALASGFAWGTGMALGFVGALLAYVAFSLTLRVPGFVLRRLRSAAAA